MKIHIEIDPTLPEGEVTIRCAQMDERVQALQRQLAGDAPSPAAPPVLAFYKDDQEFFFPLGEVLFFETQGEAVWAHTAHDAYRVPQRLYELEDLLPRQFIRAAKSAIVNTAKIYAIRREPLASSQVSFMDTHKQIYVSRHYYGALKERMIERNR